MKTAFEFMQEHYLQRDRAAMEWKNRGGKVAGYICNSVPEELIMAAGMLPVRLSGNPGGEVSEIVKYFGVNAYCESFVNTMLNDLITGKYDYLDYLIIPRSRDSIATQYAHLCMLRDLDTGIKLPELYSLEFVQTWSNGSSEYTHDRFIDFKNRLEDWSGKRISDRLLRDAIAITNENRRLLQHVAKLRLECRICGTAAMTIIGSSYFMNKEEHNRQLSLFLKQSTDLPAIEGKRLFIESSPQDHLQLYQAIESCGAIAVGEDDCWGNRCIDDMIDETKNPFYSLAQRYHFRSPCPYVYFPAGARLEYFQKKLDKTRPDGVIFYINENDAGQLWEYPDQLKLARDRNIPCLGLLHQPYLQSDKGELQSKIEEFSGSIKC
jgi:benzoyl-CoA reductase subunit C